MVIAEIYGDFVYSDRAYCMFQCSVSCGEGKATRYVACITMGELEQQITEHGECDIDVKPSHERRCNSQPCIQQETDIISIGSNRVEGTSHWRVGPWGGVRYLTY